MREDSDLNKDQTAEVQDLYFEKDGDIIRIADIEPDPEILQRAREYDKRAARKKRERHRKSIVNIAALVLICVVTMSAITFEYSDALRFKPYRLFFNKNDGAATLLAEDEYDLIGDWKDFWYPAYLPEGYLLIGADKSESEKIMLFSSENGEEIRIIERDLTSVTTIDTDNTSVEEIRVGYHQGYYLINEEYDLVSVCWTTDDRQLDIEATSKIDKDILMKVAENLSYKENGI